MLRIVPLLILVTFACISHAQSESENCTSIEICLGDIELLSCECTGGANQTFSGFGVIQIGNSYYFDSNITGTGVFTVNELCGSSPDNFQVTVSGPIEVLINGQNNSTITICLGDQVTLVATGATSYTWSPATGLSNPNIANPVASPIVTTTYTVSGTTLAGCEDQATVTVAVVQPAIVTINASDEEICEGDYVLLSFGGLLPGTSYHLTSNNGLETNTTADQSLQFPTETTTYTLSLNNYQCVTTDEVTVVVHPLPEFSLSSNEDPICPEGLTTIFASPAVGYDYSWTPSSSLNTATGPEVIASPDVTTTYTVTATTTEGCTTQETITVNVLEECCVANNQPPTYLITALSPDWIGQNYTLNQNLIVQAGVDFVINNCQLKFEDGVGIILDAGADLDIRNNSYLTTLVACPGFWSGIYSERLSDYATAADKNIINIENSKIENAATAVTLISLITLNPNTATHWASIDVQDCEFLNNQKDFHCTGQMPGNQLGIHCSNSVFVTDDFFQTGYAPNTSKSVFKFLSKPVVFANCKYDNSRGQYLSQFEFLAIEMDKAPLSYIGTATNDEGMNSESSIAGFTRGIRSYGTGLQTTLIMGTDFSCWRGVYLRNVGISTTDDCDFYCLQQDIIDELNGQLFLDGTIHTITLENFDTQNAPYGEYLDGSRTMATVLDNFFNMSIPGFGAYYAHGFLANNTGDGPNRVRRNYFTGMQRAMKLQGDNRKSDYTDGLKYSCNTFENNLSNIREVDSNVGSTSTFGVPHQLTLVADQPGDPNNNFTQSNSNCTLCGNDDLSNTTSSSFANHNYVRLSGSQEPADNETTDAPKVNIVVPPFGGFDECISSVQMLMGGGGNGGSTSTEQKALAEASYATVNNLYQAVVDGGSTEDLVNEIQGTTFSEALHMYYDLMAKSPNVSEEALVEALKKFELPNVLLTQILSSNPHAAKSGRIKEEMDNRPLPFDEYQKQQINLGLSLFSSKENMELVMAGLLSLRNEAIHEMFVEIDANDEVVDKTSAKLSLLDESIYYSDMLQKINLLSGIGEYEAARELTLYAADYFRLLPEDKADMEAMYDLLEIEEALSINEDVVTPAQESELYEMLNTTSAVVSTRALDILISRAGLEYFEPVMIDEVDERSAEEVSRLNTTYQIEVYPNPATELLVIKYFFAGVVTIEIRDVTGRLVIKQMENALAQEFYLNVVNLPPASYEVRLLNSKGSSVGSSCFIKD